MKYIDQITEIFVNVDDFYTQFKKEIKKHQLSTTKKTKKSQIHDVWLWDHDHYDPVSSK